MAAVDWLRGAIPFPDGILTTIEDRVDLRGFHLSRALSVHPELQNSIGQGGRGVAFRRSKFREIDFSEANLDDTVFDHVTIEHCDFERASLKGTSWYSAEVSHTSFRGADIRYAHLGLQWGSWMDSLGISRRSRWLHCDFGNAVYADDILFNTDLVECNLQFERVNDITMRNCRLIGGTFSGEHGGDLVIDGRENTASALAAFLARRRKAIYTRDGVDLSMMDTHGIRFVGCAIRGVKWPRGAGVIIVQNYK